MITCPTHKITYGYEPCPMCKIQTKPQTNQQLIEQFTKPIEIKVNALSSIVKRLDIAVKSRELTISKLIELNHKLTDELEILRAEKNDMGDVWGKDAAGYESEYNGD
jgi:hypothetical protein